MLGVVLCLLAYTGLSVVLNNKRGVLISALSAQDEPRFWQTVIVFIAVLVIYARRIYLRKTSKRMCKTRCLNDNKSQ